MLLLPLFAIYKPDLFILLPTYSVAPLADFTRIAYPVVFELREE